MSSSWWWIVLLALGGAGWLCGCASSLEDPERFAFLLDDGGTAPIEEDAAEPGGSGVPLCAQTLIAESCDGIVCHGAGTITLDLVSEGVAARLRGSSYDDGVCAGREYVTDSGGGLLLDKLGDSPPCGGPMPFGQPPLSDAEVSCLEGWAQTLAGAL